MTSLHDALTTAAAYLQVDAQTLLKYADETPAFDGNMQYGGMSIEREEGQFLYALVRALQPEHALEIGVFAGVSSQHIIEALGANDKGGLISVDIATTNYPTGESRWNILHQDATTADLPPADFVFEDSAHNFTDASAILDKVQALNPRVVVSHDYYSDELYQDNVGFQVRQAFEGVFGAENVLGVRWKGGQRGFGLWLNPDWQAPVDPMEEVRKGLEDIKAGRVTELKPRTAATKKPARKTATRK